MKKCLTITIYLLIFGLNLLPFIAVAETTKWWCAVPNTNKIVNCLMKDGKIVPTTNEWLIYKYFFDDYENAIKVFKCESGLNQFDNKGNVIMSKTKDLGIAQIHLPKHQKTAESLGLDLWDTEDNLIFARLLYNQNSWSPWVCWKLVK